MTLYKWSQTASADATADSTINWAEGQAPSSVNDSARAMMAAIAKYRDDNNGSLVTGGTSTAYTLSTNQVFDTVAHLHTQELTFIVHLTNGANPTLNVDGLGAAFIQTDAAGTNVPAGALVAGAPYSATYWSPNTSWRLKNFVALPYNIPIGAGMDYWGASVPNASFMFANGAAISRTTYAALFAIVGTTYGAGDGSTTFNLPNKTERVSVMKSAVANLLTSTYAGGNSTALGSTFGSENNALATANLPAQTDARTIITTAKRSGYSIGGGGTLLLDGIGSTDTSLVSSAFNGASPFVGQVATPFRTVQPTIVCNYIIRVI